MEGNIDWNDLCATTIATTGPEFTYQQVLDSIEKMKSLQAEYDEKHPPSERVVQVSCSRDIQEQWQEFIPLVQGCSQDLLLGIFVREIPGQKQAILEMADGSCLCWTGANWARVPNMGEYLTMRIPATGLEIHTQGI